MYWTSPLHHENYLALTFRFPALRKSREYAAACYICAHPEIFSKVSWSICPSPIEWLFAECAEQANVSVDLSSGFRFLANVAASLFTGSVDVNISDVTRLDESSYMMFLEALSIRTGREVTMQ